MAIDYFLKLDGIKGESQIDGHIDEIQLMSWSWGMSHPGGFSYGSGGSTGKVSVADLHMTKLCDVATTPLIQHVTSGKHILTGKLSARKSGGTAPIDYFVIDLKDIMITSFQTGGSEGGDSVPIESFSINFPSFTVTYSKQTNTGVAEPQTPTSWNIQTGKAEA